MRTAVIFIEAVIVTFLADGILRHFVTPDFNHVVALMSSTPPDSQQWTEIWQEWHHINLISVFVLSPVAAFAGGAFVGLLQKRYAALVAASTQIPELLFQLWSDRAKSWVYSPTGAASARGWAKVKWRG